MCVAIISNCVGWAVWWVVDGCILLGEELFCLVCGAADEVATYTVNIVVPFYWYSLSSYKLLVENY